MINKKRDISDNLMLIQNFKLMKMKFQNLFNNLKKKIIIILNDSSLYLYFYDSRTDGPMLCRLMVGTIRGRFSSKIILLPL